MPPKTIYKRLKMLQESARRAREGLKRVREGAGNQRPFLPLLPPPTEAIVSNCSSYNVRNEPPDSRLEEFVEEWVLSLSRDNVVSLGLFCAFFSATNEAEYVSIMLGKSGKQWRVDFLELGDIPNSQQGRHQRSGILWSSEGLNKKASKYVREIQMLRECLISLCHHFAVR